MCLCRAVLMRQCSPCASTKLQTASTSTPGRKPQNIRKTCSRSLRAGGCGRSVRANALFFFLYFSIPCASGFGFSMLFVELVHTRPPRKRRELYTLELAPPFWWVPYLRRPPIRALCARRCAQGTQERPVLCCAVRVCVCVRRS